jgi:hypothetical protein
VANFKSEISEILKKLITYSEKAPSKSFIPIVKSRKGHGSYRAGIVNTAIAVICLCLSLDRKPHIHV